MSGESLPAPVPPGSDGANAPISGDEHRNERVRRLKKAWLSSILIRPLSFLIPLITVPLFLKYLGEERYGMYETIGALAAWLGATNLGLTLGLMNRLVDCSVRDDRMGARECVSTLAIFLGGMLLFMAAVVTIITPLVDWTRILKVELLVSQREAPWAFWVAAIATLGGLIASLPASIYGAYQEVHRLNLWEGVIRVCTLVACVLVIFTPLGTAGVILAIAGTPTLVRLVNLVVLLTVEKGWLRPSFKLFRWDLLKTLAVQGFLIFLLQVSCGLLFQMDKVIISSVCGAVDVTGYAILGRMYLAGYGVFMLFLHPLWAAYGETLKRGDLVWIKRMVSRTSWGGCGVMLLSTVVLLIGGQRLIAMLPHGGSSNAPIEVSRSLILACGLTFATRAWVDCRSVVLLSANVFRPQILFYSGHALLNLVVAIPAAKVWGVEGVAWSTPITAMLTSVWGYPLLLKRYIYQNKAAPLQEPAVVIPVQEDMM